MTSPPFFLACASQPWGCSLFTSLLRLNDLSDRRLALPLGAGASLQRVLGLSALGVGFSCSSEASPWFSGRLCLRHNLLRSRSRSRRCSLSNPHLLCRTVCRRFRFGWTGTSRRLLSGREWADETKKRGSLRNRAFLRTREESEKRAKGTCSWCLRSGSPSRQRGTESEWTEREGRGK
ncbi:hypothetical protein TGGT1_254255 [Toxoplasma gondii GT1]|uniref:Uncharacterized protein n=3 Tax=Toxoplasma gondii TaxID=5811 RepID=S7VVI8_TOXGG|nr:hypothetical protein TGGT1_254255 [Toxoplasma gondii GT1]KAF4645309.1 hypothetical protein TGRH88_004110 [Toxoplasma gondii]KFG53022.1 hypothetical protein TGFOU_254255 [Toxoplasma gondii FOU]